MASSSLSSALPTMFLPYAPAPADAPVLLRPAMRQADYQHALLPTPGTAFASDSTGPWPAPERPAPSSADVLLVSGSVRAVKPAFVREKHPLATKQAKAHRTLVPQAHTAIPPVPSGIATPMVVTCPACLSPGVADRVVETSAENRCRTCLQWFHLECLPAPRVCLECEQQGVYAANMQYLAFVERCSGLSVDQLQRAFFAHRSALPDVDPSASWAVQRRHAAGTVTLSCTQAVGTQTEGESEGAVVQVHDVEMQTEDEVPFPLVSSHKRSRGTAADEPPEQDEDSMWKHPRRPARHSRKTSRMQEYEERIHKRRATASRTG